MARVVRPTKFRHVFGQAAKKSECYDGIRITRAAVDSTFCSVNPKFLAAITDAAGGGAFLVLPLEKVGRIERDVPLVSGHRAAVLDISWCPHDDNVIASASEDCTVKIWRIPDDGIKENLQQPETDLQAHQRKVSHVVWHPSAQNVLLTAGGDMKIHIWDIGQPTILSTIDCHTDAILSVCWKYDGSRIVTSSKDKIFRVIDPRSGEVLNSGFGHQSGKPARAIYLRDGRIFSTGFSKMAERQYAVWDEDNLGTALTMIELDSSNGILFPHYDEDTNIIYLCGKGDSTVRYYEYTVEAPYIHPLNLYSSSDPQRGMGFMPKRGLNIGACEIARMYKLLNNGLCEAISFIVPRKGDMFQEDLYPDTASSEAAITAEEWAQGKDSTPKLVSVVQLLESNSGASRIAELTTTGAAKTTDSGAVKKTNLGLSKSFRHSPGSSPSPLFKSDTSPKLPAEPKLKEPPVLKKTVEPTSNEPPVLKKTVEPTSNEPPVLKSSINGISTEPSPNQTAEILAKMDLILSRMNEFDQRLKALELKFADADDKDQTVDGQMQF